MRIRRALAWPAPILIGGIVICAFSFTVIVAAPWWVTLVLLTYSALSISAHQLAMSLSKG